MIQVILSTLLIVLIWMKDFWSFIGINMPSDENLATASVIIIIVVIFDIIWDHYSDDEILHKGDN